MADYKIDECPLCDNNNKLFSPDDNYTCNHFLCVRCWKKIWESGNVTCPYCRDIVEGWLVNRFRFKKSDEMNKHDRKRGVLIVNGEKYEIQDVDSCSCRTELSYSCKFANDEGKWKHIYINKNKLNEILKGMKDGNKRKMKCMKSLNKLGGLR